MPTDRRDFVGSLVIGVTALGTGCVGLSGNNGGSTTTPTNDDSRSAITTTTAAASSETASPTATTTPPASTTTATTPNETTRTDASSGRTRTTETAETVGDVPVREPPACDGSLHRLSYPIDEVRYGSVSGFSLTVSEEPVALGKTVMFRMENTSETKQTTGNKRKYDIQQRTDDGWESIHRIPENYGYSDSGFIHPPGSGFTWKFPYTRNGLEQSTQFNTPYSVCEPIIAGEYRFVYWGVSSETERQSDFETESAIGVRFTVERLGTVTTESG